MSAWLYAPTEKRALGDAAKLAAALRAGVPAELCDGGRAPALGEVKRVALVGAADLGLAPSEAGRRFVLARGTEAWCLAEIVDGKAGREEAERLVAAATGFAVREQKRVVAWLVATEIDEAARAAIEAAGGAATGIG